MNQQTDQKPGMTDDNINAYADVAKSGIAALVPADKGWIFGFIIVVGIIVISDMFIAVKTLDATKIRSNDTRVYFELIEANRANEIRRSQETIKALADAVARDSERAGMAALTAIEKEGDIMVEESRQKVDEAIKNDP